MAKENVKKFLEELSTNKELQEKLMAAQKGYEAEGKGEEEIFEDIVLPIAKEVGYDFTISEYRAIQRDVMAEKGISEEELENVSGGGDLALCLVFGLATEGGKLGDAAGACLNSGVGTGDISDGFGACVCWFL